MSSPPAPSAGDPFAGDAAENVVLPAENVETYPIPGGLSGWSPGEVPASKAGTVLKTPGRNEPSVPAAPTAQKRPRSSRQGDALALWGYNLLVFLSSVCVMTLELTASRLIAKHVGSSLYTWTSVIGVVLAGITVGNYLGGWLADRWNRSRTLSWMFLLASLSCTGVLWLDLLIADLPRPESFSWPMWILCVVAMMFLLPAILLGTTSPLVASMALARSSRMGMTVGNVYAWGAAGSIVGTFLTGFYLIDVWGTRSIIGLTSGTLAALAVVVAGQRWVFRTAVVCGWLQWLGLVWLSATMTAPLAAAVAEQYGRVVNVVSSASTRQTAIPQWKSFGSNVGEKLHELGLILKLRDDDVGGYHDESAYSYISVGDDYIDGDTVRYLRLDKLVHSYYNPDSPTTLHYEYEQVYAAVTKRAAPGPDQNVTVAVPEFPGWQDLVGRLPVGVRFDADTRTLHVGEASAAVLDALLGLSPDYDYWTAVEALHRDTNRPRWGGFSSAPLSVWPDGLTLPQNLSAIVRYDSNLEVMSAYDVVTAEHQRQLLSLGPQAKWRAAIESLRRHSAPISTLFLGGGGYIFPRWILAEFPGAARIDVAELDPAVLRVVQRELGLTPMDEERIQSTIGDARNFVDDRLRANARLVAAGQPPVLYDFIYGDAFNDFGVPWHLTTREFTQKLHDLMTPRGVLLANIIEIYPRTRAPAGAAGMGNVVVEGELPEGLFASESDRKSLTVRAEFAPLKVTGGSLLEFPAEMSSAMQQKLTALDADNYLWTEAIETLADQTRLPRLWKGTVPAALRPEADLSRLWTPCPEPFAGVELYRAGQDQMALGFRGAAPDALRQRLVDLDPQNASWVDLVQDGVARSRAAEAGRFLGRYTLTMTTVFPYVAVFSTSSTQPTDDRDTFVVVCSRQPIDLRDLSQTGLWTGDPFAGWENPPDGTPRFTGQMESLLQLAEGQPLTDDFAPVDNLLRPVFVRQDD
uniref:Spermidine synthase n=1 Tax=Schlesneria paludicola TaxID=360056 RepID=A0A7C2P5R7_9PLAN